MDQSTNSTSNVPVPLPSNERIPGASAASSNLNESSLPRAIAQQRDYEPERTLHGHAGPITKVAMFPDKRIVTVGDDATIIVWRAFSRHEYEKIVEQVTEECERAEKTSNDSNSAFLREIRKTREQLKIRTVSAELKGHENGITSIAILTDGRIASVGQDGTVRVWREQVGESSWESSVLSGTENEISKVLAFDDLHIISGSRNGSLLLWSERAPGQWTHKNLPGHEKGVAAMDRFPNGKLVTGDAEGTLRIQSLSADSGNQLLKHGDEGVREVKVLGDGEFVSLGERTACMWRLNPATGEWSDSRLTGLNKAEVLPDGGIVTFTEERARFSNYSKSGVAVWRINEQGTWETVTSRKDDWRDMVQLTPLSSKTFVLRAGWMDEGFWRRDLEIIHIDGRTLTSEGIYTRKYGESEKGDLALPDGRFGIVCLDGSLCLWQGREE